MYPHLPPNPLTMLSRSTGFFTPSSQITSIDVQIILSPPLAPNKDLLALPLENALALDPTLRHHALASRVATVHNHAHIHVAPGPPEPRISIATTCLKDGGNGFRCIPPGPHGG